ncbi:DUF559 domain-containing protein [bacterium]|nr:DUF559 domain-containing protein [bacterium]
MPYIPYKKNLINFARKLRNNSTPSEAILWKHLSGRKCCGLQFNRQKPLGKYIVDFYCKVKCLVIEIDGHSHGFEEVYQKDILKQADLESMGLTVLRFSEGEVRNNIDSVLQTIEAFIKKDNPPNPLSKGEQNLPHHIYLCGFMGSGKTTVGTLLAEKLGYSFIDTDHLIEQNEKKSISEIFANSGEAQFREIEIRVIEQVIKSNQNTVIALGGGSLMSKENLNLIKADGFLVYLHADLNILAERLRSDSARPLLKHASLDVLFNHRTLGYEAANLIIKTQKNNPAEVTEAIFHKLSLLVNK